MMRVDEKPDDVYQEIDTCLVQLNLIANERHKLVHRTVVYAGSQLQVWNDLTAKSYDAIEAHVFSYHDLENMKADCLVIFHRLLRVIAPAPDVRDQDPEFNAFVSAPWRYKPPQRASGKKTTRPPIVKWGLTSHSSRAGSTGCHPDPIDPHAAVRGLIETFEEVLDLRLYLGLLHGLGPDAGQRSSVLSGVCRDSPLGGDGFEPSVPRSKESQIFRGDRRYRISQNHDHPPSIEGPGPRVCDHCALALKPARTIWRPRVNARLRFDRCRPVREGPVAAEPGVSSSGGATSEPDTARLEADPRIVRAQSSAFGHSEVRSPEDATLMAEAFAALDELNCAGGRRDQAYA
jgi:hypothetical protein